MAAFIDLDESPMFHSRVCSLEQSTRELQDRCQRLYDGCKGYVAALTEACNGDLIFADALDSFGGGHDDPLSLSLGGPLISKFIGTFRELATYKELLRSQVEHVLVDRLTEFMSLDLQNARDCRVRLDSSTHVYDQAREKYASLKKNTRKDIVVGLEEELQNSKSAFERDRFSLVSALTSVESKRKYEFLESFSAIMDAHLRYFKLGYELLSQMEPLIHEVLTYAQQCKEVANAKNDKLGKRIQEFRTQVEMDKSRVASNTGASTSIDGTRPVGMSSSYKDIQTIMLSSANDMVRTIKQGYLLKRSSKSRADWKRQFFVLDSRGTLYYYRSKGTKPVVSRDEMYLTGENVDCRTVDLRTSTIKIDAEDTNLRLCFRIVTPLKTYTLQAETEADRMEWVNKVTGVITSLLTSNFSEQEPSHSTNEQHNKDFVRESLSYVQTTETGNSGKDSVPAFLRDIPGNDRCAECTAPDPDWASLNLGILMCIECSGAHRNLGVHISKVRSITLDVKVWEPIVLELFQALGNAYCSSVWEEQLSIDEREVEPQNSAASIAKPSSYDPFNKKEKYIQMKYVGKSLISQIARNSALSSRASALWEAIRSSNLREAYRLIAISDAGILYTTFDDIQSVESSNSEQGGLSKNEQQVDPSTCPRLKPGEPENCLRGCSLLHLACHVGKAVMVELLLQFGADVNTRDFHGRTPLHHCIAKRDHIMAKYLVRRGAKKIIKDWGGLTALERAVELGSINDEELFLLLDQQD